MRRLKYIAVILYLWAGLALGQSVEIQSMHGEVRVRQGLSEDWSPARTGMTLRAIDSILSGETGGAVLRLENGASFRLGSWMVLDIGDLRRISERDLFLYLMSEKVKQLPDAESRSLKIARVSVVRAEDQSQEESQTVSEAMNREPLEFNGARALFDQAFVTNAVMKVHRLLEHYPQSDNQFRSHYLLGQCHEALHQSGRALEAYCAALAAAEEEGNAKAIQSAKLAVQRLESAE